ncbi:MAG: PLP-dependent aminotransferase family protein, partial [Acidobacteriales bacterium]|nr:PLP-dependent aminotransferase family protein [Terriglobales bacterium]
MKFPVKLDRRSTHTLHEQLYDGIRQAILSGALSPGQRVPSSRELAELLDISRSTVTDCYEQLLTEGFFEARAGSGTFVTRLISKPKPPAKAAPKSARTAKANVHLSSYGKALASSPPRNGARPDPEICFYGWRPAFDEVPVTQWTRVQGRRSRRTSSNLLDYASDQLGYKPLREAIAEYIARSRGVKCAADQVLIVLGLQQALDLVAKVHVETGNAVAVENPGYPQAWRSFAMQGGKICPIPVDESGLIVENLSKSPARNAKLIYLTPSHQFPTGAVMPLARRLALLSWAHKSGGMILEDDYDSEFRYTGKSIPALQGLDEGESVVYVGTFTKVLYPSLSVAYMVVPPSLVNIYAQARLLASDQVPLPLQDALAEFIEEGHLDRHIKRMRA